MIKQRLMGAMLVLLAGAVVALASTGTTPEDQDATAAVLIGPLGLYMIFTREYVLYDGEPLEDERPRIREPHHKPELDPWAPTSPGAAIDPLFPWNTWEPMEKGTNTSDIKKGAKPWQENVL